MSPHKAILCTLLAAAALTLLQGCFTGVESTPKISYREVKRQHANEKSAEQALAETFTLQPPSQWQPGKRFYVNSDKINLALQRADHTRASLAEGDVLLYEGTKPVPSIVGNELIDLTFSVAGSNGDQPIVFSTGLTAEQLAGRDRLTIPFTIDLDLVDSVAVALRGRHCYIRTPQWLTPERQSLRGTKYTPVTITDVRPANDVYPCMVLFTTDDGRQAAIYIAAGPTTSAALSRDLPSTFSFTNPRDAYPQISDEMWANIINSRVENGMTTTEARLALGAPASVDRATNRNLMFERWTYTDGIYLIFEDGILTRHN